MTPANQLPQAPRVGGLASVFGPMLFQLLGPQGSLRRMLLGAGALLLVAMNKRWELGMDFNTCVLVLSSAVAMVVGSNVKEAMNVRSSNSAQAMVQVAYHEAQAAIASAQPDEPEATVAPAAQAASPSPAPGPGAAS